MTTIREITNFNSNSRNCKFLFPSHFLEKPHQTWYACLSTIPCSIIISLNTSQGDSDYLVYISQCSSEIFSIFVGWLLFSFLSHSPCVY